MSTVDGIRQGIYSNEIVRRLVRWFDAVPHPQMACEIARDYVAAARWGRSGGDVEAFAIEPLPPGALTPTAIETNVLQPGEVRAVVGRVFSRLHSKPQDVALLLPDPVIRVFVLHFDVFPRSVAEAVPLLRWRLKKSVPFEAEETLISFMRQAPRQDGVDIVTGLARLRIIREYEQLLESVGMSPGVVMSSTMAALPLLDDQRPALLARVAGKTLTTAIVRGGLLCGYRCMDMPAEESELSPQMMLDELYPITAYYQDTWGEGVAAVCLAGLTPRFEEFRGPLERELLCPVTNLLVTAENEGRVGRELQPMAERGLDALVGWKLHRGA